MSVPSSPTRLVPDLETVRVKGAGDLFHGRLPEPTQPGPARGLYLLSGIASGGAT